MSTVEDLARTIRDAANAGLRVTQGTVVEVVDGTHVSVDLGDRVITAYRPGSVAAPAGAGVRVLVGSGVAEVISSSGATGWTNATLLNSWANYLAGTAVAQYRKVGDVVEVRGSVKSGSGVIFTLPDGLRPALQETFYAFASPGGARVDAMPTGDVQVSAYVSSGTNAFVSLAGIHFSTT